MLPPPESFFGLHVDKPFVMLSVKGWLVDALPESSRIQSKAAVPGVGQLYNRREDGRRALLPIRALAVPQHALQLEMHGIDIAAAAAVVLVMAVVFIGTRSFDLIIFVQIAKTESNSALSRLRLTPTLYALDSLTVLVTSPLGKPTPHA